MAGVGGNRRSILLDGNCSSMGNAKELLGTPKNWRGGVTTEREGGELLYHPM